MPSFWTHVVFAKECKSSLPSGKLSNAVKRHPHAYYTGMQGPDMFMFYLPAVLRKKRLSTQLHTEQPDRLLSCIWTQANKMKGDDREIALAYATGFFGHYCLDSETHPFVYAFSGTARSAKSYCIHNALEADLNALTVERTLRKNLCSLPLPSVYSLSPAEEACIGQLLSRAITCIYKVNCTPETVIRTARSVRRWCKLLYDASGRKAKLFRMLETPLKLPYLSPLFLGASHYYPDSANLAHHVWQDPYTGQVSTSDFFALYDSAKQNCLNAIRRLQSLSASEYSAFFRTFCLRDFHGEIHCNVKGKQRTPRFSPGNAPTCRRLQ